MSQKDRDAIESAIRDQWPGYRSLPLRGAILIPQVRDGGATDALIKLAAKIADEYYQEKS